MPKGPLNYTTTIDASRTLAECHALPAKAGASSVAVHYDDDGNPAGLSFGLRTPHGTRSFTLPVNVDGMRRVLLDAERDGMFRSANKARGAFSSREHAARVAWRVMKDWLEANLALIHAGMASLDEVMLPYLHWDAEGHTLYQAFKENDQRALPGGES